MARDAGIPLLTSPYPLFESAGYSSAADCAAASLPIAAVTSDADGNGSSENSGLTYTFKVLGGDFGSAGSISTKIKRVLQQIGAHPDAVRKASIATYEAR